MIKFICSLCFSNKRQAGFFMRVCRVDDLRESIVTPTAVCLGVFDGVHLGHRRLIEETLRAARQKGLEAFVHTYDPLPMCVIAPEKAGSELTPLPARLKLIGEAGILHVAVSSFNEALQHMPGRDFFEQVLLGKLNAKHIVAGFNHRFGFKADTNVKLLEELCREAGIGLSIVPPVRTAGGKLISSSAIRLALQHGDLGLAAEMLGRPVDADLAGCVRDAGARSADSAPSSLEV